GTVGAFLAEGIRKSRGSILCFLDDDDLFYPTKLEVLEREFFRNPRVGYYHNYWRTFEAGGSFEDVTLRGDMAIARRVIVRKDSSSFADVMKRRRWITPFNLSCVSVRREVANPYLSYLSEIKAATDAFFIVLAFISNFDVVFSNVPLSHYRIHVSYSRPDRSNIVDYCKMVSSHSRIYSDSLSVILGIVSDSEVRSIIEAQIVWWKIRAAVFG
ncbi:glycosyl transferase family protein, partial [mine drainage metagenome]